MVTLGDAIAEIDVLKAALFGLANAVMQTGLVDPKKLDSTLTLYAGGNPNPPNAGPSPSVFLQTLLNLSN